MIKIFLKNCERVFMNRTIEYKLSFRGVYPELGEGSHSSTAIILLRRIREIHNER